MRQTVLCVIAFVIGGLFGHGFGLHQGRLAIQPVQRQLEVTQADLSRADTQIKNKDERIQSMQEMQSKLIELLKQRGQVWAIKDATP
jgi:hypothetical protein